MQNRRPQKKRVSKNHFLVLTIFCIPFLMFYWMLPFVSDKTLGSDYINYHIYHQLDLLFSVKTGSFPLYAPSCYYGQSSAYPHAQLYHPMGYMASLMPGFWQGYSLEWLTLFRLITLAACHFCLFLFLRRWRLNRLMAFALSLITVYNLRMLSLFWNVIALESYTGTIFLCAAIGCYYLKPAGWRVPLLIIATTYWLITSGFPPMVFYGVVGTIIFTLVLPFLHNATVDDAEQTGIKKIISFWGKIFICCAAGFLLSSAYLWPFFWDYMRNSSGRVDQPYLWAAQWTDTLAGTINNFFLPLGSGFSMFGGSPLFLAAVTAPIALVLARIRVPVVVWTLLGVVIACFLYMQGDRTPVHYWAWQYIPLVSALRDPGRVALILPLMLMMILVWLAGISAHREPLSQYRQVISPMAVAAIAGLLLMVVYFFLPDSLFVNTCYGCPFNLRKMPAWVTPAIMGAGMIVLVLLFLYFITSGKKNIIGVALAALTVFQLMITLRYGPYAIADKEKTPTYDQILAQKKEAINFQPVFFLNQHAGSRVVVRQLKNYFMESDLAKIYRKFIIAADIDEVYNLLNNDRQSDEVVVEGFTSRPEDLVEQPEWCHASEQAKLTYSSCNRLVFSAKACQQSFFVFSYPYSGRWQAWLNGREAPTYRANGAAHAIRIPPGEHTIELRYGSNAAFYGMIISCLTLAIITGLAGLRAKGGLPGFAVAVAGLVFAAGLFELWYYSLYTGDNLGTRYEWHSPPPEAPVNIAFGNPTQMSSHTPGYPYLYNSRHAVDGGRGIDSCFFTDREKEPWWQVDLRQSHQVKKIVLYSGFSGGGFNQLPLIVSFSDDGRHWRETRVDHSWQDDRIEIVFEPTETLRYVNIKASGECVLSLNEVEIY